MSEKPEWFQPTSGRLVGTVALAGCVLLLGVAVWERQESYALPLGLGAAFFGVLAWAAVLRPRLAVTPSTLVLRNMLETIHLPLAAIEEVAVRQVLAVRAGDRRYVSPAVGKSWRKIVKSRGVSTPAVTPEIALSRSYPDFVEARIRQLVDDARTLHGIRRGSPEQVALAAEVRRQPAWAEIAAIVTTGLGFLLVLFF